ncbi:OLC1v1012820C1 [Oldenlandia corymbosa var. corymbosa]|uniref:OLC1v1012820C1 n=1 Tax=Oldenlandia corymbosa var. corymbosa TaxID=529605 RepID=A0AAV1DWS0_OLDCO|nr:OLC1v1012820C1 [Oldenlandia corymbosa var. corymbosa]
MIHNYHFGCGKIPLEVNEGGSFQVLHRNWTLLFRNNFATASPRDELATAENPNTPSIGEARVDTKNAVALCVAAPPKNGATVGGIVVPNHDDVDVVAEEVIVEAPNEVLHADEAPLAASTTFLMPMMSL